MFKALNCLKIRRNTNLNSFKIIITSFSKKKIAAIKNTLDAELGDKITSTVTEPRAIEITALGVSKASAANHIMSILHLKKEDAAALGDSGNDVPLLEAVGLPIAINSKNLTLIKNAKYIISKFKNGVSKAIEQYIL
jgi:HAD superfamily hydrolase (TIGR01484 family)